MGSGPKKQKLNQEGKCILWIAAIWEMETFKYQFSDPNGIVPKYPDLSMTCQA